MLFCEFEPQHILDSYAFDIDQSDCLCRQHRIIKLPYAEPEYKRRTWFKLASSLLIDTNTPFELNRIGSQF